MYIGGAGSFPAETSESKLDTHRPDPDNAGVGNEIYHTLSSFSMDCIVSAMQFFFEEEHNMTQSKSHLRLRALCEGAIFIALAQVLSYLKLFELPQGGSITIEMLPIFLYCARWASAPVCLRALPTAFCRRCSAARMPGRGSRSSGDYLLAFTVLGFAGACSKLKGGFFIGHGCRQRGALSRALCRRRDGLGRVHARDLLRPDDDDTVVLFGAV